MSIIRPLLFLAILLSFNSFSQNKTENVFIITTDDLRWQEVFGGADSTILFDKKYTTDSSKTVGKFWAKNSTERGEKLMPFFWKTILEKGQIYGNRWLRNKVNITNPYQFSYSG